MIVRSLQRYEFIYDEGKVILRDKKKNDTFVLPMAYVNSFVRAAIAFKEAYRIEQVSLTQSRVKREKEAKKRIRKTLMGRIAKTQEKVDKIKAKNQL